MTNIITRDIAIVKFGEGDNLDYKKALLQLYSDELEEVTLEALQSIRRTIMLNISDGKLYGISQGILNQVTVPKSRSVLYNGQEVDVERLIASHVRCLNKDDVLLNIKGRTSYAITNENSIQLFAYECLHNNIPNLQLDTKYSVDEFHDLYVKFCSINNVEASPKRLWSIGQLC